MTFARLGMTRGGFEEPITRAGRRERIASYSTPITEPCEVRVIRSQDGCWAARHCLDCPLPECQFARPRRRQSLRRRDRDAEIRTLLNSGTTARTISEKVGVSLRTVARVRTAQLAEHK